MQPLISVIINVYNGEKFIRKCLDCVVNQTYKNLEILIVNDGSTDNTLSICESYDDSRIRIINQENMGLALARNVAIDNAKGDYLYFVDVDDWIANDVIEYLLKLSKMYGTMITTCKSIAVFDYNVQVEHKKEIIKIIDSKDMLKKVLLSLDNAVTIWNKLIKRELFDNIRFENRTINDVAVTYKLIIKSQNITYSNQIKYYYLKNIDSITAKQKESFIRAKDNYELSLERYNYIKSMYPYLIENEIGMLRIISMLYLKDNEEIQAFLEKEEALKLFRKLFDLKSVLVCKLGFAQKIRIILMALNPKLCRVLNKKYQLKHYKYKM